MQAHGEAARTDIAELTVHPGLSVIEATPRRHGEPLGQATHRSLIAEPNVAAPQTVPVIDPHRIRSGDQDLEATFDQDTAEMLRALGYATEQ